MGGVWSCSRTLHRHEEAAWRWRGLSCGIAPPDCRDSGWRGQRRPQHSEQVQAVLGTVIHFQSCRLLEVRDRCGITRGCSRSAGRYADNGEETFPFSGFHPISRLDHPEPPGLFQATILEPAGRYSEARTRPEAPLALRVSDYPAFARGSAARGSLVFVLSSGR